MKHIFFLLHFLVQVVRSIDDEAFESLNLVQKSGDSPKVRRNPRQRGLRWKKKKAIEAMLSINNQSATIQNSSSISHLSNLQTIEKGQSASSTTKNHILETFVQTALELNRTSILQVKDHNQTQIEVKLGETGDNSTEIRQSETITGSTLKVELIQTRMMEMFKLFSIHPSKAEPSPDVGGSEIVITNDDYNFTKSISASLDPIYKISNMTDQSSLNDTFYSRGKTKYIEFVQDLEDHSKSDRGIDTSKSFCIIL